VNKEQTGASKKTSQKGADELTAEAHFYRGLSLHGEGHLELALQHFQVARRDPRLFAKATAEMANVYHQLGRVEDEVAAWEELFAKVRETGYQFIEEGENGRIPPGTFDAQSEVHLDPGGESLASKGVNSLMLYPFMGVVVILMGAVFMLFKKMAQLRRVVSGYSYVLNSKKAKPEPIEKQPAPEPDLPSETPKPEAAEPSDETPAVEEKVSMNDTKEEPARPAEETAMEVISLSEQGYSIQEIAEKLGLGQDEVRLILNLQREEKAAAE
jgi:hypothetical protein